MEACLKSLMVLEEPLNWVLCNTYCLCNGALQECVKKAHLQIFCPTEFEDLQTQTSAIKKGDEQFVFWLLFGTGTAVSALILFLVAVQLMMSYYNRETMENLHTQTRRYIDDARRLLELQLQQVILPPQTPFPPPYSPPSSSFASLATRSRTERRSTPATSPSSPPAPPVAPPPPPPVAPPPASPPVAPLLSEEPTLSASATAALPSESVPAPPSTTNHRPAPPKSATDGISFADQLRQALSLRSSSQQHLNRQLPQLPTETNLRENVYAESSF